MFPAPRVDRVSPGHLVAVVTAADGRDMIVWRWFDAVVLGENTDGSIRLWEPAHGEIAASPRTTYVHQEPGSRAYVSAGLPGAQWWVADIVDRTAPADVELTEVEALFTENDLWAALRL